MANQWNPMHSQPSTSDSESEPDGAAALTEAEMRKMSITQLLAMGEVSPFGQTPSDAEISDTGSITPPAVRRARGSGRRPISEDQVTDDPSIVLHMRTAEEDSLMKLFSTPSPSTTSEPSSLFRAVLTENPSAPNLFSQLLHLGEQDDREPNIPPVPMSTPANSQVPLPNNYPFNISEMDRTEDGPI